MGIFSFLSKPKNYKKTDIIEEFSFKLNSWERSHFPNTQYSSNRVSIYNYNIYQTDSKEKILLSKIKVPTKLVQNQTDTFFDILKGAVNYVTRKTMSEYIFQYFQNVKREINCYKSNRIKFNMLSSTMKDDPLFAEIEHIVCVNLKMLYNELIFCKFENIGDASYFNKMDFRFTKIYMNLQNLNNNFSNYMYALSNIDYENTKQDIERIRINVEAMSEVADDYTSEALL